VRSEDSTVADFLLVRGRLPSLEVARPGTCQTYSFETVDDDRASSLLGVLPIS
jgi:hypothetical protein